jgi:hypothetical protein
MACALELARSSASLRSQLQDFSEPARNSKLGQADQAGWRTALDLPLCRVIGARPPPGLPRTVRRSPDARAENGSKD